MRRILAVSAAAVLAACSALQEQRPVGNAFKAPAGWTEFPMPVKLAINPVLGMWTSGKPKDPGEGPEFITLLRFPSNKTSIADQIMTSSGAKNTQIVNRKTLVLCNGSKGVEMEMKGTSNSGGGDKPLLMNVVIGQGKGEALVVIYAHPADKPPEPAVLTAARALCPIQQSKT